MAVEQLPDEIREFAQYFNGLLSGLDQGGGWCGVFWQRDPEGMRACLDGAEVPPWDVVEAVLQDLAAHYGDAAAAQQAERVRALHAASLAAYDARPGGRDALYDRLDVMLREQRYAAERLSELGRSLHAATTREEADSLRLDLAWARDDHDRATARCAEIRHRIDALDRRSAGGHAQGTLPIPLVVDDGGAFLVDQPGEAEGGEERKGEGGRGREGRETERQTEGQVQVQVHGQVRLQVQDQAQARGYGEAHGAAGPGRTGEAGGDGPGGRAAAPRVGAQRPAPDEDDWPDLWRDASADRAARQNAAASSSDLDPASAAGPSSDLSPSSVPSPALDSRAAFDPDPDTDSRPASGTGPGTGTAPAPEAGPGAPADPVVDTGWAVTTGPATQTAPEAGTGPAFPADPVPAAPAPKRRFKRRVRGGARSVGTTAAQAEAATEATAPPENGESGAGTAALPAQQPPPVPHPVGERPEPAREPLDDEARRTTAATVENLVRLRREGRSGEAHTVLVEAAYWPAAHLPLLAAELHRAGLGADWATLLWEAVSLPADRLVAAADALVAAGRAADGEQMLRQGVVRPAAEIGEAVLDLAGEGRHREVRVLLDAYVRVRTPEEAARSADADPRLLAPLLLEAARDVSEQRHWDLVHALRVAGHAV
ncbi:hypothetical protein [Streptomyces beigongshangae]|uniref:hypothetical protein n=1 Tax=Streptomyces beigongshangae TaxID=2841597 RepID=UPI001C847392|nr:hypothetical protein [Streptomyces sp. REN17]